MAFRLLEIACFNTRSAVIAQAGGADRIELCSDMNAGGTTPDLADLTFVKQQVGIPVYVMIRPRGGNFVYSADEFQQMKQALLALKQAGADGFVFGCLTEDNRFQGSQNQELLQLAYPLPCTFHRAIDLSDAPLLLLEEIIACGFSTILSSGTAKSAVEGISMLKNMIQQADGRICIMPGGGIRSSNIQQLRLELDTMYFHSSAVIANEEADLEEIKLLKSKLS